MKIRALTKGSLEDWAAHYAQGNELPDDVIAQLLHMAERDVSKASLKEALDEMIIDEERVRYENDVEFKESDCCEAMHNVEHADYMLGALYRARAAMFPEQS
jgi:hypothetical protein